MDKGKMLYTSVGQRNCTKVKWGPSGEAAVQQKKHLKLMVNQHDADIKKANPILGSIVTRVICKTHRQSIPLHLRNEDSISTFWESDRKKSRIGETLEEQGQKEAWSQLAEKINMGLSEYPVIRRVKRYIKEVPAKEKISQQKLVLFKDNQEIFIQTGRGKDSYRYTRLANSTQHKS